METSEKDIKYSYTSLYLFAIRLAFRVSPILFSSLIILALAEGVLPIIYARLQGNLVDSFTSLSNGLDAVLFAGSVFIAFIFLRDTFWYFYRGPMEQVYDAKQERFMSRTILEKYASLDIGTIEQASFQTLRSKVTDRAMYNVQDVATQVRTLFSSGTQLLVSAAAIFTIHPLAAAAVVLGTVPAFVVETLMHKENRSRWDALTRERRIYWSTKYALESKNGMQEMLVTGKVGHFISRLFAYLDKPYNNLVDVEKKFMVPNIFVKFVEAASIAIALYFVIMQAVAGVITIGDIVFSIGILFSVNGALGYFVNQLSRLHSNAPYISQVREFLDVQPTQKKSKKNIILDDNCSIAIRFDSVSFKYPGQKAYVLRNVSFTLNAGSHVALVGLNGAGKSTIIKLMLKMYAPTKGKIFVNGTNLQDIDTASWYRSLGILMQDYGTYNFLSIKEVLNTFAKGPLEEKRIEELLQHVRATDFVKELPQGVDTVQSTEYGGKELSGGQFQKIAIARTLARDASFILLDEPTSAIDALSEEAVFETLSRLPDSITLLFISHRFTTIRNAERIIVIDNGEVAEEGQHEDLMRHDGLYAKMYKTQVLGEK
jgi:ATP-binding cassette subfamily B protein